MTDSPHATAPRHVWRKRLIAFFVLDLLLCAIGALAWHWHGAQDGRGDNGDNGDESSNITTRVGSGKWVAVQQKPLTASIEQGGTLAPADVSVLNAPFDGNIDKLSVAAGETVSAGQALFGVTSLEMQARHNEAFANASRARNTLNELRQWDSGWQMAQARQAVERAASALERARKKREQIAVLLDKGIAAAGELSDAGVELEAAKDALANARQQLEQEVRKASAQELQLAASNHEAAQALFQHLSSRLALATVHAPRAGVLVRVPGAKSLANGLKVSQDEALIGVWDGKSYLVRTQIDQRDIKHVAPGLSAMVRIDAIGASIPGKVSHVAFESNDGAGQAQSGAKYEVEIRLTPATPAPAAALAEAPLPAGHVPAGNLPAAHLPGSLRPGMSASVTLTQASFAQALTVPLAAIRKTGATSAAPPGATTLDSAASGSAVPGSAVPGSNEMQSTVLVKQNGRAVVRAVRTGLTTADSVQILSGLQSGDEVWVVFE